MPTHLNKDVDNYIQKSVPPLRDRLQRLRHLIHETLPGVEESIKWGRPVFSRPKNICYLQATKDYVTLGFYDGAKLNDPNGLLEGQGKRLKHVKIRSDRDIRNDVVKQWLKAAAQE